MSSQRDELLNLLRDPGRQRDYRRKGKQAVLKATGASKNACAATACQPLIELGLLDKVLLGAQALADELERRKLVIRIESPAEVLPGDLIVCQDYNRNGKSDHVWWALSAAGPQLRVLCFDNQGFVPVRWRNLGRGPKTPMAYALRLKDLSVKAAQVKK